MASDTPAFSTLGILADRTDVAAIAVIRHQINFAAIADIAVSIGIPGGAAVDTSSIFAAAGCCRPMRADITSLIDESVTIVINSITAFAGGELGYASCGRSIAAGWYRICACAGSAAHSSKAFIYLGIAIIVDAIATFSFRGARTARVNPPSDTGIDGPGTRTHAA